MIQGICERRGGGEEQGVAREQSVNGRPRRPNHDAYRTEVATLIANGAWYVHDAESNNTDCAASVTDPSLKNQFWVNGNRDATIYWLAATNRMYLVSGL
jgi:hypothetical protein